MTAALPIAAFVLLVIVIGVLAMGRVESDAGMDQ